MKEKLYTIPLNDAMQAQDECPFCFIERKIEQDLLDFILGSGSSYMQSNIRDLTDKFGFCREHYKKMYQYGNALGNSLILKTHIYAMQQELSQKCKTFKPSKVSLKEKLKKTMTTQNPIGLWTKEKKNSCYICSSYEETHARYIDTFFIMYQTDPQFQNLVANSKGFCLPHFGELCEAASTKLKFAEQELFYPILFALMEDNMSRIHEDVSWFIEKFDYKNKEAEWKNSKDSIQRCMQKLSGSYPSDAIYKSSK